MRLFHWLKPVPFVIGAIFANASNLLAAEMRLGDLPVPVQAYVLKEAVKSGVEDPFSIALNANTNFDIVGAVSSDLNADGIRDYAVSLCQFSDATPAFRTNGFECAFGNLIVSNVYGGYDFFTLNGVIVASKPGADAALVISQRGFERCTGYVCDFSYTFSNDREREAQGLFLTEVCEIDTCLLGE